MRGQIAPRPVGFYLGLELSMNPITTRPSYIAIADLPLAERVAILRDPAFKAKILAEEIRGREVAGWIEIDRGALKARVAAAPGPGDWEPHFNPNAVVEYYSR